MSVLNPTTFLDLVQRTHLDCGVAGDPPATIVNASGEALQIAGYVNEEWIDIQSKHDDWMFTRVSPGVSFVTVAAQVQYTPTQAGVAAGVSKWLRNTFRSYKTSVGLLGEVPMIYHEYDEWRDGFYIGALRTAQVPPIHFTIGPDFSLFVQCPLVGYTITGDYHRAVTAFTADADAHTLPQQFAMLIVGGAMRRYALFESAPEVLENANRIVNTLMPRLENSRLKEITTAGSL